MNNDMKEGLKAIATAFPPPKGLVELGGALSSPFAPMAKILGAGLRLPSQAGDTKPQ